MGRFVCQHYAAALRRAGDMADFNFTRSLARSSPATATARPAHTPSLPTRCRLLRLHLRLHLRLRLLRLCLSLRPTSLSNPYCHSRHHQHYHQHRHQHRHSHPHHRHHHRCRRHRRHRCLSWSHSQGRAHTCACNQDSTVTDTGKPARSVAVTALRSQSILDGELGFPKPHGRWLHRTTGVCCPCIDVQNLKGRFFQRGIYFC